jgi:hypothetical protein
MGTAIKVMRVSTRCRTVEEFVALFAPLVDEESILIVTTQPRRLGARQAFELLLASGEVVMRGDGEVIEAVLGQYVRLRFLALDGTSRDTLDCMLAFAQNKNAAPKPRESGRKPVVKIPDPTTPPKCHPLVMSNGELGQMITIPPVPAPLLPTMRVSAAILGAPPAMPDGVPEQVLFDGGITDRVAGTTRFYGLEPPPTARPRFAMRTPPQKSTSTEPPEAVPEAITSERNSFHMLAPLVPPVSPIERERVTCRVRDVRATAPPDARVLIAFLAMAFFLAIMVGFLVGR